MGIFSRIKKASQKNKNTIWARYMRFIVPAVIGLIVIMDIAIYMVVAKNSKDKMTKNCYSIVDHQSKLINGIFNCYVSDMSVMREEYHKYRNNPEEYIRYCKEFITHTGNVYTYVRLMLPDGTSYTTVNGKDPNSASHRKPFKQIFEQDKEISVNNAHPTDLTDYDVFSISIPIKENGKTIAIICSTFPSEIIDDLLEHETEQNAPGFIALVDDDFYLRVYHGETKTVSIEKLVSIGFDGLDKCIYGGSKEMEHSKNKIGYGTYYSARPNRYKMGCHYMKIGEINWFITLNMPEIVMNMDILVTSIVLLITAILTIVVILLIIKHITQKVVMNPLQAINRFTKDFAEGKLYSTETRSITNKDELATVRDNIEIMQHKLSSVVESIRKSTMEVSDCSATIKGTVSKISEDASVQSACVGDISSSIDSMNTFIMQNAELASNTKTNSEQIECDIDMITMASDNTLESMQNVISKIKVINEISTRTDLLAINAAVEAARAGDNGKGFAVVAAEIRKLAEHCQKASKEINELSSETLFVTEQSAEFIQNTIPKIRENAEDINKISDTCNQQLEMTQVISQAIMQLVDITSNNTQSSEEMQEATVVLFKNMEELKKQMEFFKLDSGNAKHRDQLIAEIEHHTSEILMLKSKLVGVAESMEETQEIDEDIDRALQSATSATNPEAGSNDTAASGEASDTDKDEFFDTEPSNTPDRRETAKSSARIEPKDEPKGATINLKANNGLDDKFEEF